MEIINRPIITNLEVRTAIYEVVHRNLEGQTMLRFFKSLNSRERDCVERRHKIFIDLINQGVTRNAIALALGIPKTRIRDEVLKEAKKIRLLTKKNPL